jgi:peroxiredoxin
MFKNTVIAIAAIAFFAQACKSNKTQITGTIEGVDNTELLVVKDDLMTQVDTVKVVNGKFTYSLALSEPTPLYLLLKATGENKVVFADNSNITLSGKKDDFKNAIVKGSKTQDLFESYTQQMNPILKQAVSISEKIQNAKTEEEGMVYAKEYEKLDSQETILMKNFISKNASSPVSSFLASSKLGQTTDTKKFNELYSILKGDALTSVYGKKLTTAYQKMNQTKEGAMAPDFTLPNVDGKNVSLSSYKGKYVLVDFWASWCHPCRDENPNVVKAYTNFHAKGFEILGVSLDDNADNWKEAIAEDGLTWTQISDLKGWESQAAKLYGIQSIPSNLLIDPSGKIIARDLRGDELQQKLSSIYK